ncbi:GGDEF domain-containing protein [Shewanella sp. UCD-KL12]|uniref:tetratricopeptide repeat-containing diguanylate cyclase n=1 Tax=Shewanella sp. UCD-KL12 TaxID=1917163 RepID=UPI000970CE73|nr:GGDEF domain-containing protein [Shewanella sp. UCD-KL12]
MINDYSITLAMKNHFSMHASHVISHLKIIATLFALLVSHFTQAEEVSLSQLNSHLTMLEAKRTIDPALVSLSIKELDKLLVSMDDTQKVRFMLLKAHSYSLAGRIEEAISILSSSDEFNTAEMQKYETRKLALLANIYSHDNQFEKAFHTLHLLIPKLITVDDIESEVFGYRLAVELLQQINLYTEALKYATTLYAKLDRYTELRHRCFVTFSYAKSVYGVHKSDPNYWGEIVSLHEGAYTACELSGEKMFMSGGLREIADIEIKMGNLAKAKQLLLKSIDLSRAIFYELEVAEAELQLSSVDILEQELTSSQVRLSKALGIAETLKDKKLLADVYKAISELNELEGNSAESLQNLKLYQSYYSKVLGETQSKIVAFETTKLDYLEKERQIRYLNQERELYTTKRELIESQRNNEHMLLTLIIGGSILLAIFALVLLFQKRKYKRLAQLDTLTGIFNRGTAQNIGENSFIQAATKGESFSVVMFDLDNFKNINDNYGHGTGDWVLKKVAEVIDKHCRRDDTFARFGGEEFALFLPDTKSDIAESFAHECCEIIRQINTKYSGHSFKVTASFGVTSNTQSDLSLDPLLHRADIAMYCSKKQGRNRVSVYHADMEQSRAGYQASKFALG